MMPYVLRFSVALSLLFSAEMTIWAQQSLVSAWTTHLTSGAATLARVFYPLTIANGLALLNPANGFGVVVAPGCNGIEAVVVLWAAILAFPASAREKFLGLAAGFIAIQGLNLLRIVSLFAIGQWDRHYFEVAHLYVWQALIMLDVLIVWCLWVRHVRTRYSD